MGDARRKSRRGTARGRPTELAAGAGGPLVIGHRGASAHATENTLGAFERAARDGADGVELDVLCCATGEVVVFHDDDLRGWPAGPSGWRPALAAAAAVAPAGRRPAFPPLDEAFEACGPRLLVNVELKSAGLFDPGPARGWWTGSPSRCDAAGPRRRVMVSSFDPRAVGLWQQAPPRRAGRPAVRGGGPARRWARRWRCRCCARRPPTPRRPSAGPSWSQRWHAAGYRVNTWTVDDPGRLRALARHGGRRDHHQRPGGGAGRPGRRTISVAVERRPRRWRPRRCPTAPAAA